MDEKLAQLKAKLGEIQDITGAIGLLSWDQTTYMPEQGAPARGRQLALLSRISQEMQIDPEISRLLDDLEKGGDHWAADSDEAALIKVARRTYERMSRIPPEFLGSLTEHIAVSYQAWAKARPENDFAAVTPYLEKTLDYSRQIADFFPGYDHVADPLIDFSDYGMKAESIRKLFAELRQELVPLVETITEKDPADNSCLHKHYPEKQQLDFGMDLVRQYGFDMERGRMDLTHHPFMTKFSLGDVRITTRVDEHNLADSLFSLLHECGHALYELGINGDFERSPLNTGTSAGVHESQSRLWENIVGRSRAFWEYQYPKLQAVFPEQLGNVTLDQYYRAINKVQRSLIRTEADEVTYNLHVMIRFDLELQMLEGQLAIKDLPDAWHARYQSDLGLAAPDDSDGCLQDVHWYAGLIGGSFQGYTLGNVMGSLFYDAALNAHPTIPQDIAAGNYQPLHQWLISNIYQHGQKYTADELIERTTGGPLTIKPYINYLSQKFGDLYDLS